MKHVVLMILVVLATGVCAQDETIALSGTVFDQDGRGKAGVIVSLAEAGLADTTGSDGAWSLADGVPLSRLDRELLSGQIEAARSYARWNAEDGSVQYVRPGDRTRGLYDARGRFQGTLALPGASSAPVRSFALLKAPSSTERLVYSLQGQIITEDVVGSYIAAGIEKYIQEHSVSGTVNVDSRVSIDSVFAWFDGGLMTQVRRARLGYNAANHAYSGRVYTVKSITGDVYDFRVWINVMGNGNHKTGISDTVEFTSDFGAIDFIPVFAVGNALPRVHGTADTVSIGDSLHLFAAVSDSFDGAITDWEYRFGAEDWRAGSVSVISGPPQASEGGVGWWVRATDDDGNTVTDSGMAVVVTDAPVPILSGPASALVYDSAAFHVSVSQKYGSITQIKWDLDDGQGFVSGSDSALAAWSALGSRMIRVQVTDDDGNTTEDSLAVEVTQQASVLSSWNPGSLAVDSVWTIGVIDREGVAAVFVSWGDGILDTFATGEAVSHAYSSWSSVPRLVRLEVTDSVGGVLVDSCSVMVTRVLGISGKVVDQSLVAVPGAVVALVGSAVRDTVDASGGYQLVSDTLGYAELPDPLVVRVLSSEGLVLDQDTVTQPEAVLDFAFRKMDVSGTVHSGRADSLSVKQVLFRYVMQGETDTAAPQALTWYPASGNYSGAVYIPKPTVLSGYTGWAVGLDSLGHRNSQSPDLAFTSAYTGLVLSQVAAGNALPAITASADTVSINDTIHLQVAVVDSFGGNVIRWQYKIGSMAWDDGLESVVKALAPSTAQVLTWSVRAMDNDSNVTERSGTVNVLLDAPVLGAIAGKSDPLIGTQYTYSVPVQNRFGELSWFWKVDNGAWVAGSEILDTTFTTVGAHTLTVRVQDDDGLADTASLSVAVHNDAPVILGAAAQTWWQDENDIDFLTISDSNGIDHVIWDFGDGSKDTTASTWSTHLWALGNYTVQVTAYDPFGVSATVSFPLSIRGHFTDARNGESYSVVSIGGMVWMTRNLNYGTYINSNRDQDDDGVVEKYCFSNMEQSCDDYFGGQYQWAEAMALPNSCNSDDCSAYISLPYHQGICPDGYHIPTDHEFNVLEMAHGMIAPDTNSSLSIRGAANDVGTRMRSADLWSGAGLVSGRDSLGFHMDPSGLRSPDEMWVPDFGEVGTLRSATQVDGYSAWARKFWNNAASVERNAGDKADGYALRCVADNPGEVPIARAVVAVSKAYLPGETVGLLTTGSLGSWRGGINSYAWSLDGAAFVTTAGNGSRTWNLPSGEGMSKAVLRVIDAAGSASYDTVWIYRHAVLTDSRDGRTYPVVTIGKQVWMAANLNYGSQSVLSSYSRLLSGQKYCYGNLASNCTADGGLYQWHAALAIDTSCTGNLCAAQISAGNHRGICPTGWHVPRLAEFDTLLAYVDAENGNEALSVSLQGTDWGTAELQGRDRFGFVGNAAGLGDPISNQFYSQESALGLVAVDQYNAYQNYDALFGTSVSSTNVSKYRAFSLRCVQD